MCDRDPISPEKRLDFDVGRMWGAGHVLNVIDVAKSQGHDLEAVLRSLHRIHEEFSTDVKQRVADHARDRRAAR
jgi:hypothetical protein